MTMDDRDLMLRAARADVLSQLQSAIDEEQAAGAPSPEGMLGSFLSHAGGAQQYMHAYEQRIMPAPEPVIPNKEESSAPPESAPVLPAHPTGGQSRVLFQVP